MLQPHGSFPCGQSRPAQRQRVIGSLHSIVIDAIAMAAHSRSLYVPQQRVRVAILRADVDHLRTLPPQRRQNLRRDADGRAA